MFLTVLQTVSQRQKSLEEKGIVNNRIHGPVYTQDKPPATGINVASIPLQKIIKEIEDMNKA